MTLVRVCCSLCDLDIALSHTVIFDHFDNVITFFKTLCRCRYIKCNVWCLNWCVLGWREKGHSLTHMDWFGWGSSTAKQRSAWKCSSTFRHHSTATSIKHCMEYFMLKLNCIGLYFSSRFVHVINTFAVLNADRLLSAHIHLFSIYWWLTIRAISESCLPPGVTLSAPFPALLVVVLQHS